MEPARRSCLINARLTEIGWLLDNFYLIFTKFKNLIFRCYPNPCTHNSKCTQISNEDIECNCGNSGFFGQRCDISKYSSSCEEMNALGWPLGAVEIINSNQAIKVICAREKGDGIEIKKNIYIYIYNSNFQTFSTSKL
jgi:hypothetical protein